MADANLLEVLHEKTKLDNMIVYGNIRCAINKPSFLSGKITLTDGFYALVDVLALRCNGIDYFDYTGYQDSKHIYFSKGSIVIACNEKELIGKNVRVYGKTLSNGCTIKKQRTKSNRDGIVAFAWTKVGDNWGIVPNRVVPLGESDVKGTVLEDYIVNLVSGQSFTQPKSLESIMEYAGVSDAQPIELDKVTGCVEYSTDEVDLTKIPLNLTHRLWVDNESEVIEAIGDALKSLRVSSRGFAFDIIKEIRNKMDDESEIESEDLPAGSVDDAAFSIINKYVDEIVGRYNLPLDIRVKTKGKEFVIDFLDNLHAVHFAKPSDEDDEDSKLTVKKLIKEIEALKKSVQLDREVLRFRNVDIPVLKDEIKYASLIIGNVTGIGVLEIVSNYNSMFRYNGINVYEWFWCLIRNPYLCGLMGSELNVCDCDKIFLGFSRGYDFEDCMKYRAFLMMLEAINKVSSRSTIVQKNLLKNPDDVYPALGKRYIEKNGTPFNPDCLAAVTLMRGTTITNPLTKVSVNVNKVLKELNEKGLIEEITGEGYILASDLHKEYTIYTELIKKGKKSTGISDEEINKVIEEFEESRGFKLEDLQKDGIQLIQHKAGVLSGCAGSGKTTTSDCMVMGIKKYLKHLKCRFGAPTGKAARRLAEVVGGDVKTIHSMFGLGLSSEPYIKKNSKFSHKNDEGVYYAYFLDEMAMANMNLMFEIVDHLNEDDLVYFLGDIKQLSPIGKGSPFRALMKFLPCVELGVSKRAAANGKINYNCGLINFVSDDVVVELKEGEDFEILPCADVDIQRETVNTFKKYLNDFAEDDIQVVTGYQTDKYPWSTVNLNPLLQNILRKEEELLFMYNNTRFMKNDRVIHVKRNAYEMPRYRYLGNNHYEEVVTFGVVNGELGKLVGYVRSDLVIIDSYADKKYTKEEEEAMSFEMKELIIKRSESNVEIRDDSEIRDEHTYFVVVQVYDVDLKEDVYVFYIANFKEELSNDMLCRTFVGGDLKYLELAYALTCHKMQGSQSPAIIIPLGSSGNPEFMNRNMLNTMITRASKKVGLIGSVKGKNSALTNGRRHTNVDEGVDVLGFLSE